MRTVFRNEEIPARIAGMLPFLSVGRLPDGTRVWSANGGPALTLGHLPAQYHQRARSAVYVVYSYDTPIAWVLEEDDTGRDRGHPLVYEVPDVGYSPTTAQHQWTCLHAWEDEMRAQGTYHGLAARGRPTVRVPGNAIVYGRERRLRHGGVDFFTPGYGTDDLEDSPDVMDGTGHPQGLPVPGWQHHPAHP